MFIEIWEMTFKVLLQYLLLRKNVLEASLTAFLIIILELF